MGLMTYQSVDGWDIAATSICALMMEGDVTNTGKRPGAEVAQVYVSDVAAPVPRPVKELKGFAKVELAPGETRHVRITLNHRALSYFDPKAKRWQSDPGEFRVLVGSSSARIELRGKLTLK